MLNSLRKKDLPQYTRDISFADGKQGENWNTLSIRCNIKTLRIPFDIASDGQGVPVFDAISKRFGFLLTPGFAPLGFFAALEVLRTANRFLEQSYYGWQVYSVDGCPVTASNGVSIIADLSIADAGDLDHIFVCAGFEPKKSADTKTLAWLHRLHRYGVGLGAISTGTYILAIAGILEDRKCTIHFDQAASLREDFPEVHLVDGVFENDRGLATCAGGTSAMDLFMQLAPWC